MTTKEIAGATGKPEQTVRNWIRSLASKSDVIKSKLDASSPMKPADYDLVEVCEIIEEGLGKEAANVYRTNAVHAKLSDKISSNNVISSSTIRELRLSAEKGFITKEQFQVMIGAPVVVPKNTKPEQKSLPSVVTNIIREFFSVEEHLKSTGHVVTETKLKELRHKCYDLSTARKVTMEPRGSNLLFHHTILTEVFAGSLV
jgi:hypothetical protein